VHVRITYGQMDKHVVQDGSSVAGTIKKSYEGEIHMNRLYPKKATQSRWAASCDGWEIRRVRGKRATEVCFS
jgi:hypothetical protein